MSDSSISMSGDDELKAKLNAVADGLAGPHMASVMERVVAIVTRDARLGAPVDTGMLKNSITGVTETGKKMGSTTGIIGSNLTYAPFMELGTKPHMPPLSALQVWARRHGVPAFAVARAIRMRGIKPRFYLKKAHEKNEALIKEMLGKGVDSLVNKS